MDRNLIDNLMDSRKLETMDRESGNKVYNKYFVPKYSIVVPLHNEQENVTDLYDRLKVVMETHGETFEIVLVDDGSSDHHAARNRGS
jgi:cellulose synthase/poly-beta-1,6-N-acetylglucosamine synthase-like glycosyltransferase